MSKVTVKEAALLSGKSRETINAATKSGRLSYSLDGKNKKVIDVAELERVYPLTKSVDEIRETVGQGKAPVRSGRASLEPDVRERIAGLTERLAASETLQATLTAERVRERRQLEDEIAHLRETLAKAQDQHNKALLLITDETKGASGRTSDWERSIKALEKRIGNQEQQAKDYRGRLDEATRKIDQYRQALRAERNKSFWKKLFG
ncbi:hypothetical protein Pla108_26970 [Botrimarina colliarenosi]|uniref:Chromosome partition protein Smc n=1 Tax=Botrimarina colliarenosi TaxID=2528001 RepID=A0A5C6ACZ0_9BACT|nr:hypothetical protein [Botrimarina colliarenosi]TWT96921.1 hypothetical protein Pla108_26970 [Botrimarina colliarenosi]